MSLDGADLNFISSPTYIMGVGLKKTVWKYFGANCFNMGAGFREARSSSRESHVSQHQPSVHFRAAPRQGWWTCCCECHCPAVIHPPPFKEPSAALPSLCLSVHSPSRAPRPVDKRNPTPVVGWARWLVALHHPLLLSPMLLLISQWYWRFPEREWIARGTKHVGLLRETAGWAKKHTPWHWYHTHTLQLPFLMLRLDSLA